MNDLILSPVDQTWYLGLEIGTTGISALLFQGETRQFYPIIWSCKRPDSTDFDSFERLPLALLFPSDEGEFSPEETIKIPPPSFPPNREDGFLLKGFKSLLKMVIPYQVEGRDEPVLQWSDQQTIPLIKVREGLGILLSTLKVNPAKDDGLELKIGVEELDREILSEILSNLAGVLVGTPTQWGEAYRFNIQQAVLEAQLVSEISQIFVVEELIGVLLSQFYLSDLETSEQKPIKGGTLIIDGGANSLQFGLVNLPENHQDLTYNDFIFTHFPLGGNALEQDIICQILMRHELWGYESSLPRVGHPDLPARYQLQRWLQSSPFSLALIDAAQYIKNHLSEQEYFYLKIGKHRWEIKRREVEVKVLVPFVQQLNRQLNQLLIRVGWSTVAINQAIYTGELMSLGALTRWLRQKLPNAIIIDQRRGMGLHYPLTLGLASLPLYPSILNLVHSIYNDYFLLQELIEVLGENTMTFAEINQLLEQRGIHTRSCSVQIFNILEGELPVGLFPTPEEEILLSENSLHNSDYHCLHHSPIFGKTWDQKYSLNLEVAPHLSQYLKLLLRTDGEQEV